MLTLKPAGDDVVLDPRSSTQTRLERRNSCSYQKKKTQNCKTRSKGNNSRQKEESDEANKFRRLREETGSSQKGQRGTWE